MGASDSTLSSCADPIIEEVMEERKISPFSIQDRWANQNIRGKGKATCTGCGKKWTSHQASGYINLRHQKIVKIWKQKCDRCKTAVEPFITPEEMKRCVNAALDDYIRKKNGDWTPYHYDNASGPPHRKDLCEGCDYGQGDCRKRSMNSSTSQPSYGGACSRNSSTSQPSDDDSSGMSLGAAVGIGAAFVGGALLFGALAKGFASSNEEEDRRKK